MRQVVITRRGGPEVLEVREAPDLKPAPGQVRIRVRAAGVNFADVMARVGMYPDAPPLPGVLGYEVSGEIDLPIDRAGEKVIALTRFGGQSEMVCVPAGAVIPMPSGLSFAEAASIPVVWLTAWHMLVELGNLRRGHVVLIHAAAGGVGTAAVQICRKFGATSIGTASSGKHERLRELGLSHAIDYRKLDFEQEVKRITGGRGVDIALDPVGTFRKSFRCLAPVGRLMMYGASATVSGERRNLFAALGTVLKMRWFHPLQLLPDNKGIFGVNMGQLWGETELLAREMREVLKGFSAGEFKAIVDQEVPFAEARRAHERLQARKNFGKVVLVP
ncbi:MAG: zinc-binding dehydrogenase [Deltaproteobacteria bacterium]|nr:MAG: zinc-binding dehydrogenase [Deltaproteobacteria bacterium]